MTDALSTERFNDLVASYGADLERWPADRRGAAIHTLVASEAARAAWRDAADLDGDLDAVPGLKISPDLAARVMAIGDAPEKQANGTLSGALRHSLPYAAAAAIALVVGLNVPSPFRDATDALPENQAAVSEPAIDDDANDGLTELALVDVRTLADDETDSSASLNDDSQLTELPLL
jgi:hypothetical protein